MIHLIILILAAPTPYTGERGSMTKIEYIQALLGSSDETSRDVAIRMATSFLHKEHREILFVPGAISITSESSDAYVISDGQVHKTSNYPEGVRFSVLVSKIDSSIKIEFTQSR
jgi:hypothetical protein